MAGIPTRVARIAEVTLAEQQFVTPIDVLVGLGWLAQPNVDRWQRGRVPSLDRCIGVDEAKTAAALDALQAWAHEHGLQSWDTDYGERPFTAVGDPATERTFRARWASAEQFAPEAPRAQSTELSVISALKTWICASCGHTGDLLRMTESGAYCLDCADLGHLVFLPAGDAALTRRAKRPAGSTRRRAVEQGS